MFPLIRVLPNKAIKIQVLFYSFGQWSKLARWPLFLQLTLHWDYRTDTRVIIRWVSTGMPEPVCKPTMIFWNFCSSDWDFGSRTWRRMGRIGEETYDYIQGVGKTSSKMISKVDEVFSMAVKFFQRWWSFSHNDEFIFSHFGKVSIMLKELRTSKWMWFLAELYLS